MCDNTSAISVVKNPVFHKKMRHVERRHHFPRDSWPTFSPNPLILLNLLICGGKLLFVIYMAWFEEEFVLLPCILYIFLFSYIFFILT
jgi:hypothetical protein